MTLDRGFNRQVDMKISNGTFQAVFRYERFLLETEPQATEQAAVAIDSSPDCRIGATPNCAAGSNFEEQPIWVARNCGKNTPTPRGKDFSPDSCRP